jgi:serine/threonine protein phosphatase PrpC
MSGVRIADQAGVSDAGRKRRRNEDSFVVDPPLFVVADGMGGAQAGEVASRLAAAVFREFHEADELSDEARVEATVQEANRRIYERAHEDANASGMGTTVTAALVGDETIAIAHVGDSRAYRVRGDAIEQLTDDHSLVADMVRSGRLSAEEADSHPQRSVITRALGTDLDVDVDTLLVAPEDGDIYLLCSDGLTTMVPAEEILRIVRESEGLEQAARALVKAANRSGGEDNITVVLFSVAGDGDPAVAAEGDTAALDDTLVELEPLLDEPPSGNGWETIEHAKAAQPPPTRRRRRRRWILGAVIALVVAGLIAAALWGLANAYFIGAEDNGRLAVYQGLPYDLGGGVSLYRVRYVSLLDAAQLSEDERAQLLDHDLMSYDAALARLTPLEADALPGP